VNREPSSSPQKHHQRCPPRIRGATGVRRRVSPTWPCLIQREASDTVSCRCPPRFRVRVCFGSGKRRTTVSEHHSPKSNCCSWERVTCSSSSGHIIHLALGNLHRTNESEILPAEFPFGEMGPYSQVVIPHCMQPTRSLNWSLFLPLSELRSLGLSNYCFSGFIRNQGTKSYYIASLFTSIYTLYFH